MVSARSLLTTCDCVNMRFYRLNLGFCVNYDSNYNSTSNLKQAILTKSFCCVPYHVSVPVLKHYYLYEIRRVIWNSSAKCAVQGNLLLAIIDKARTGKADGYGLRMFWSLIFSSQVE